MRLIITAIDMMLSDTHKVVIHDDGTHAEEHVRTFNVPIIAEVTITIMSAINFNLEILFFIGEMIN